MEASERREYKPMDCKFLRDGGLLCMLYVRGCKLPVLGHFWSRYVFDSAYTLLSLSVLKIMNKLPTLKKLGDFTLILSNFFLKKWEGVVAVGPALLVGLGGDRVGAGFPRPLLSVSFTKRPESFVVL